MKKIEELLLFATSDITLWTFYTNHVTEDNREFL